MKWFLSHRADPEVLPLADRHYNRQSVGSPQFVPPGRCLVLKTRPARAVWVTSWPFAEYVKHQWAGAWVNSLFRREGGSLASQLIREAVMATRFQWPDVPEIGMITFVDGRKVREKQDVGRCYLEAGFKPAGHSKDGKLCLRLAPEEMPEPEPFKVANPIRQREGMLL